MNDVIMGGGMSKDDMMTGEGGSLKLLKVHDIIYVQPLILSNHAGFPSEYEIQPK